MGIGKSKIPLQEQFQLMKRQLNKSIRELDRERTRLEREEASLKSEIRKAAQKGDIKTTRMMAKDLARLNNHSASFFQMRSQLHSVGLKLQSVKSTHAMSESLQSIPKLMAKLNKQTNIPQLQKIMKQFLVESEKLGLTQDFLDDVVEGVVDVSGNDEIEDQIVNKILEEVGVDLSQQLLTNLDSTATSSKLPSTQKVQTENKPTAILAEDEPDSNIIELEKSLEERLKRLNN